MPADRETKQEWLNQLCDEILEASIPDDLKDAGSLAIDWTDAEAWIKNRRSPDPDAGWGRRRRRGPGSEKDDFFYGFHEHLVILIPDEDHPSVPELVRRTELHTASQDTARHGLQILERLHSQGVPPGDLVADAGYSYANGWTLRVHELGYRPTVDLHPSDRGMQGTVHGALLIDNHLYCPRLPDQLKELDPTDTTKRDLRNPYRFQTKGRPNRQGDQRHTCPAAAGKLRCPLVPESLSLPHTKPTIDEAPNHPPAVCRQKTITIKRTERGKNPQTHPYGTTAWKNSYNRRTTAERGFARSKDNLTGHLTHPAIRSQGLTKHRLIRTLIYLNNNLRILALDKWNHHTHNPTPTNPQPTNQPHPHQTNTTSQPTANSPPP